MTTQKYTPKQLTDVIFPNSGVEARVNAYANGRLGGNILLYGPNGTGKTSLANLLPNLISGNGAYIETKSADELMQVKGLEGYVRNAIAMSSIFGSDQYYWLFNEFDTASGNLAKLWNVMDKFTDYMRLIITTNDPMNVHKSIRSRCLEIHMPAITPAAMLPRADLILKGEGLVLPYAQLLYYLKSREVYSDIRKYNQLLDDLILLHEAGKPMPAWSQSATKIRVV